MMLGICGVGMFIFAVGGFLFLVHLRDEVVEN